MPRAVPGRRRGDSPCLIRSRSRRRPKARSRRSRRSGWPRSSRKVGHPEHAHGLRRALALGAERAVLFALDETCQTLLSMVEGFDPETEGMIEQLRLSLDRRLKGSGPPVKPPAPR